MLNAWLDETQAGIKIAGRHINNFKYADNTTLMAEKTSLVAQTVKRLPTRQETQVQCLGWEDLLEKEWQPTPVFLPGKSHGQRILAGYSPRGHKRVGHDLENYNNANELYT